MMPSDPVASQGVSSWRRLNFHPPPFCTVQVDTVVGQAQQVYQSNTTYLQQQLDKQKQFHASNLESYRAAREQYLKKVWEEVVCCMPRRLWVVLPAWAAYWAAASSVCPFCGWHT